MVPIYCAFNTRTTSSVWFPGTMCASGAIGLARDKKCFLEIPLSLQKAWGYRACLSYPSRAITRTHMELRSRFIPITVHLVRLLWWKSTHLDNRTHVLFVRRAVNRRTNFIEYYIRLRGYWSSRLSRQINLSSVWTEERVAVDGRSLVCRSVYSSARYYFTTPMNRGQTNRW